MEEAMRITYFCRCCYKIVNPIMEFGILKCPFCRGFNEVLEIQISYWIRGCFSKKDAFLDLVLPGHKHGHGPDSGCTAEHQESKQAEADSNSPRCYPEPEEVTVPALSLTDQTSPPRSPSTGDSTPSTPSAMIYDEDVDFKLK